MKVFSRNLYLRYELDRGSVLSKVYLEQCYPDPEFQRALAALAYVRTLESLGRHVFSYDITFYEFLKKTSSSPDFDASPYLFYGYIQAILPRFDYLDGFSKSDIESLNLPVDFPDCCFFDLDCSFLDVS